MQKITIGTAGRIFTGVCSLLFGAGALAALMRERDWGVASALGGLAAVAAYATLTGIDPLSDHERHRTGRLTVRRSRSSDDQAA